MPETNTPKKQNKNNKEGCKQKKKPKQAKEDKNKKVNTLSIFFKLKINVLHYHQLKMDVFKNSWSQGLAKNVNNLQKRR